MEPSTEQDRLRAAFEAGLAAAQRGEEAAPGCTATPEGHAFLDGYIEGRRRLASGQTSQPK